MPTMPRFFSNLLHALQDRRRGRDMRFLCDSLLSERGEASQTAIAAQIISTYRTMTANQRLGFFTMLCDDFSPDPAAVGRTAAEYQRAPGEKTLAALAAAVEAPRQELIRRINTAAGGTETLVTLREHVLTAVNGKSF